MYINGGTANIIGRHHRRHRRELCGQREHATANGGGLALEGSPQVVNVTGVTIGGANLTQSNGAQEGGGVYLADGTNTITGGSVDFNQAIRKRHHTTSAVEAAASRSRVARTPSAARTVANNQAVARQHRSRPRAGVAAFYVNVGLNTLTDETITDNTATSSAGFTADGEGGGLWTDDVTTGVDIAMTGGSIAGNSAYEGGGVYVNDGTTDILPGRRHRQYRLGGRRGVLDRDHREPGRRRDGHDDHPVDHQRQRRDRYRLREPCGRRGGILADGFGGLGCNTLDLTNDTIAGNTATTNGGGYYGTACTSSTTRVRADGPPLRHVRRQQRGQPPAGATSRPTTTRCSPWARPFWPTGPPVAERTVTSPGPPRSPRRATTSTTARRAT